MRSAIGLIGGRDRLRLTALSAGMLVAMTLELVGLAAIPAFVALMMQPEHWLDRLPWFAGTDSRTIVLIAAGALAGFFVLKNLYLAVYLIAENRFLRNLTSGLSIRLFDAYLRAPYTFHLQRNPAELIRNVSSTTTGAVEVLRGWMSVARESLVLIVAAALLLIVDPWVSMIVFLVLGATAAGFYLVVRRVLSERGRLVQAHHSNQLQAINQGLGAIKEARILGREPHLLERFGNETVAMWRHEYAQRLLAGLPRLFLEVVAVIGVLVVAVVFALAGRSLEGMLPVLALLAVVAVRLIPALNLVTGALSAIRYHMPALEVVSDELAALGDADVPATGEPLHQLSGGISLREVRYRYADGSTDALRGITLDIAAGEAVAFIGPTGSGKSTLMDVMLGMLSPTAGAVLVDGRDISSSPGSWQRHIGYVPQDIYLLDDTIRRNIAFGLPDEQIDEDALNSAVDAAQLDGFIRTLPSGLDAVIGNRGVRLSGGQRQRIGIARALYHHPSVLFMDEATSALDHETEREVIKAINRLRGDRTIVMIAHRFSTVRECDRIFLLRDGQVCDEGDFQALQERRVIE